MNSSHEFLLRKYDDQCGVSADLADYVTGFLRDIFKQTTLNIHAINGRVKSRSSLQRKIARPDREFKDISQIHDVVGVRVITYLNEDVDRVAQIVEKEFKVQWEHSSDKRSDGDPERFGYKSLHYVAELKKARLRLPEFKRYQGFVFEIQIRSIIQHAWAEIEHDLGYKSNLAVPKTVRRKFSRLSALLELADEEFTAVAREVHAYQRQVTKDLKNEKSDSTRSLPIDVTSLQVLIANSPIVSEIDEAIAKECGASLVVAEKSTLGLVNRLVHVGIFDLLEVEALLKKHRKMIVSWASEWLGVYKDQLMRGISIFYLIYVALAQKSDEKFTAENLAIVDIGGSEEAHRSIAKEVSEVYKRLLKST
jgi:ppGpp synthetase/RelA/SpoT-type nucleotidyltranferase